MRLSLQCVSQAQRAAKPTEASKDLLPRFDPDSPGPDNYYRTERGSRLLMELRSTADRSSLPVAQLLRGVTTDACLVCRSGSVPKSVSGLIRSVGLQKKPVVEVGASLPVPELLQCVTTDACLVCWSGSVPKSVSGLIRSMG